MLFSDLQSSAPHPVSAPLFLGACRPLQETNSKEQSINSYAVWANDKPFSLAAYFVSQHVAWPFKLEAGSLGENISLH